MFRKKPTEIHSVLQTILRNQGLETPLLQRRLVMAWDDVVNDMLDADMAQYVIQCTESKEIRNQTLWIKLTSPALRSELQMRNSDLVTKLNNKVGAQIITSIRFW